MTHTKEQIEAMNEQQFRADVLLPIMETMGYQDVRIRHGSGELGKDLISWKTNTWGERENWAVVGKSVRLTGKAAVLRGSVGEINTQILEAFGEPYDDPITTEKRYIDRVIVACNKPVGREFVAALGASLRATNRQDKVEVWDNQRVWELYEQYVLSPMHKVLRTQADIASFDPNYALDVRMMGDTTHIGLREKYPGAAQKNPITGTLRMLFDDSEEGQAALQKIKRMQSTGEAIELDGAYVGELDFPMLKKILGVDPRVSKMQMMRAPTVSPIPVNIEVRTADNDLFRMGLSELRVLHGGEDEVTLSDEHQPGPIHALVTLNWKESTLYISFPHEIKFPISALGLHAMLWLRYCMSKPFTVSITQVEDGAPLFGINLEQRAPIVPEQSMDDIELAWDLAQIQLRTGREIIIPRNEFTEEEVSTINLLRAILHFARLRTEWTNGRVDGTRADAEALLPHLKDGKLWFAWEDAAFMSLFGRDIPLGTVKCAVCAYLANETEVRELVFQGGNPEDTIPLHWSPPTEDIEIDGRTLPGNTAIIYYLDWTIVTKS